MAGTELKATASLQGIGGAQTAPHTDGRGQFHDILGEFDPDKVGASEEGVERRQRRVVAFPGRSDPAFEPGKAAHGRTGVRMLLRPSRQFGAQPLGERRTSFNQGDQRAGIEERDDAQLSRSARNSRSSWRLDLVPVIGCLSSQWIAVIPGTASAPLPCASSSYCCSVSTTAAALLCFRRCTGPRRRRSSMAARPRRFSSAAVSVFIVLPEKVLKTVPIVRKRYRSRRAVEVASRVRERFQTQVPTLDATSTANV